MRTGSLQHLFETKLCEYVLCAEGPAVAFDREVVKGGERLNIPKSYGNRTYEFIRRWDGTSRIDDQARASMARLQICRELQDELRTIKVSPILDHHPGTLEWKVAIARDRRSEFTVAFAFRCHVKTVREVKAEIRERILKALDTDGATVRKVAEDFGISKSLVGRIRTAA